MQRISTYKYKTISKLGDGGFGYVEKIQLFNSSETHSDFYARKVLAPKVDLKMYKERFQREVISQDKCQHGNVVRIYLCDLFCENPFFIMELAECDLQSLINNNTLSEKEKIDVIMMVCAGLSHIHKLGFLHRDIKPFNILRFSNGIYKVSDFGLVRKTIQQEQSNILTSLNMRLGTDDYFAPELLYKGNDYSEKSDIFAMGRVFEQLQLENDDINILISKCTSLDPRHRYSSIQEFLDELKATMEVS
ncbi:serine/threonine-protein kinase [Aeromonas veronii]|uniref:serine/threonine-protein kinase n=1 Tax=Aeromonas veronii TaxID=654 RepID=UPI0013026C56|nr:serine/threonine-protein kinase [Aeromonas veronii]KAE9633860.1 protein kinase [Aeromonas veronii]